VPWFELTRQPLAPHLDLVRRKFMISDATVSP
jgi:hypothetical protein